MISYPRPTTLRGLAEKPLALGESPRVMANTISQNRTDENSDCDADAERAVSNACEVLEGGRPSSRTRLHHRPSVAMAMETVPLPTRQVHGLKGLSIGTVLAPATARTLLIAVGSSCPTFGLLVFESPSPSASRVVLNPDAALIRLDSSPKSKMDSNQMRHPSESRMPLALAISPRNTTRNNDARGDKR